MAHFQFDENNSSKDYIKRCKKSGLADIRRFQKKHRNKELKDPQMLTIYLALGGVLVTWDRHMIDEHQEHIPEVNPGIIIVEHAPGILKTLTQKSAEKILETFKATFPEWHSTTWGNSIVRIDNYSVTIGRKIAESVQYDYHVKMDQMECANGIKACLANNATFKEATR